MACIFCKIISGVIPSNKVYEDENVLCFHDLNPQAPVHVLIVPKEHVAKISDIDGKNSHCIARIFEKIPEIAKILGITDDDGFRVVANCGENAGQSVFHIHFHLLSGRPLSWPPG